MGDLARLAKTVTPCGQRQEIDQAGKETIQSYRKRGLCKCDPRRRRTSSKLHKEASTTDTRCRHTDRALHSAANPSFHTNLASTQNLQPDSNTAVSTAEKRTTEKWLPLEIQRMKLVLIIREGTSRLKHNRRGGSQTRRSTERDDPYGRTTQLLEGIQSLNPSPNLCHHMYQHHQLTERDSSTK